MGFTQNQMTTAGVLVGFAPFTSQMATTHGTHLSSGLDGYCGTDLCVDVRCLRESVLLYTTTTALLLHVKK